MKKTVLVLSAAVALSVMTAPIALAQENTTSCDSAKTKVLDLQSKLKNAESDENVKERDALKAAKEAVQAAQATRNAAKKAFDEAAAGEDKDRLKKKLDTAEDALTARKSERDKAQEKIDKDSDKVISLRTQVELAIQERDDACGTAETTTPTPTPTPEPENDVDCDEVDASEAQRILDQDRNDPNFLDQDKDGIACELDEILPDSDNDDGVTVNNNVAVPSGGISTGVGPRDS